MAVTFTTSLPDAGQPTVETDVLGEIAISWSDAINNGDYRLQVRESGASSWDETAPGFRETVVAAGTTGETITGVQHGEAYEIRLRTETEHATGAWSTATALTKLPSPTSLTVDSITASSAGLSWQEASNDEKGFHLERAASVDGGFGPWTEVASLPPGTTSTVDDGLDPASGYRWRVVAYTEHVRAPSEPVQASLPVELTTEIPDVAQPSLDAGTEDEIAVSWSDSINYGEYRGQIRETGASAWDEAADGFDEFVVDSATTSEVVAGLEDGEVYEVRLRTETEHVTGTWSPTVAATTVLPAPSSLSIASVGSTSATLTWVDESDNETGFRLERAKEYPDGFGPWRRVATVAADTESVTDAGIQPGRTYRWRLVSDTDDAESTSDVIEATAHGTEVFQSAVPADGWHVEVDHPNLEQPLRPPVLDGVERKQVLNDQPRVRVPVPKNEAWDGEVFTDASMRVWLDGRRLPIEEMARVEQRPGETVLVGVGGVQLERGVDEQITQRRVDDVVRDLLDRHTDYAKSVDDPESHAAMGLTLESTAVTGFDELVATPSLDGTEPVGIDDAGDLSVLQATHLGLAGTDGDLEGGTEFRSDASPSSDPVYIEGSAAYTDGPSITYSFETAYEVPSERVGVAIRVPSVPEFEESTSATLDLEWGGETYRVAGGEAGLGTIPAGSWARNDETYSGPDIPAGEVVTIEFTPGRSAAYEVDALAFYDVKYAPAFEEPGPDSVHVDDPDLFPTVTVETIARTPSRSVTAAAVDGTFTDVSGPQRLEVSNDGGTSWKSAVNTETFATTFDSPGPTLEARITLGAYGQQSRSPRTGYLGQSLSQLELNGDLDDAPLVIADTKNGSLLEALRELATYSNSIFEVQWDETAESISVEWTQPGQRSSQTARAVSDWSAVKTTETRPDVVRVEGGTQEKTEEVQATSGGAVDLAKSDLIPTSEVLRATDGTEYERGADYEVDWIEGTVTATAGGSIADGEQIHVAYRYNNTYSETVPGASPPLRRRTVQLPGAVTEQACGIAARQIVKRIDKPLREATVRLPEDGPWSLVDAIDVEGVPTDGAIVIRDIENLEGEQRLILGSRPSFDEFVKSLRSKLEATARRT